MEKREVEEQALLTGIRMRESADVKADETAHNEFKRVKKILTAVGKNDALYEAVINDYCRLEADIVRYRELLDELTADTEVRGEERYKLIAAYNRQIEKYRKQRREIEKENGMTIASSARSIPKTVSREPNPLLGILNDE